MWRERVPGREPVVCRIESGAPVWWCGCGRLASDAACVGPHAAGLGPAAVDAARTGWVWLCGCHRSGTWPLCDGSHRFIPADEPLGASQHRKR